MEKNTTPPARVTVGVDLGDRHSHLCVLDPRGEVIERSQVVTEPGVLQQRFTCAPCRVVLEVGAHSPWVQPLLEGLGHEVVVGNPRRVRLIFQNDRKQDRLDAESLARLGRMDPKLLYPVRHRGEAFRQDLAVLRSRSRLVEARTQLVNHARGVVKSFGGRLRKCSTASFPRRVAEQLPEGLRPALEPVLGMVRLLSGQIREHDRRIERMATERYPETELLTQVPGVGVLTATAYVLTIEDPFRFRSSRSLGAYLGLRPRRRQSGGRDPELHVSKAGDPELRRLLVQAAHYLLGPFGPDCDLRRGGLRLVARGGKAAKKRAVVAVARKLAVLLHRLWVTAQVYEPLYHSGAPGARAQGQERIPA